MPMPSPGAFPARRSSRSRAPARASVDPRVLLDRAHGPRFVAIDFETADYGRESACAIAAVVVEDDAIVDTFTALVRPPSRTFRFTSIHGITWEDVRDAPTYAEIHGEILARCKGASFVAAHNASFDASVMRALCEHYGLEALVPPWACTVRLARGMWNLESARLPVVCDHLGLELDHHDATSDATACARIVIEARRAAGLG